VEELTVLARADLVNHVWLEVDVKRTRDVFPRRRLGEEGTKAVGAISSHGVVASKAAVRLSSEVSEAPAEVHLDCEHELTPSPCSTVYNSPEEYSMRGADEDGFSA